MTIKEKIEANRTSKGGWTKDFLKSIGVKWPPSKGWKQKLIREEELRAEIASLAVYYLREKANDHQSTA